MKNLATGFNGNAVTNKTYGTATATGNFGTAAALGDNGTAAATGCYGHAAAGHYGRAQAGDGGIISIMWWDLKNARPRLVVGYVGESGIKADTWYRVSGSGELVEVAK